MNAIGSMAFVVSLYPLAISHSEELTARCGSLDLCSSNVYKNGLKQRAEETVLGWVAWKTGRVTKRGMNEPSEK